MPFLFCDVITDKVHRYCYVGMIQVPHSNLTIMLFVGLGVYSKLSKFQSENMYKLSMTF